VDVITVVFVEEREFSIFIRGRIDPRIASVIRHIFVDGCGKTHMFLYIRKKGVVVIPRGNTCYEAIGKAVKIVYELRKG